MTSFNWDFPYPSQRMPVLARNVVATSQPLAAQAGLHMLRQGGNAIDAAVATAIAMTVLEPTTNGLGSDSFALVWFNGKLHGLNGSGRAPKSLALSRFAGKKEMPHLGWDPVTVPGAVSAWMELSKKFGKLPFAKLFEPAIEYAANGYPVAPLTADLWQRAPRHYKDFPEWGNTFLKDGKAPAAGEIFKMPNHARTLREIAESNGESFYRGELARKIAACAKEQGGAMEFNDLAAHGADWVEPISIEYRGYRLNEIPPNGQGLAALQALGMLRHRNFGDLQVDCPDVIHLQIEAMKLAFADAHRYIADPRFMNVTVEQLLDPAYLESRAKLIDPAKAQDFKHGEPKPGGTILLCTADAAGNMVSYIQSQYEGFGSGVVIPGTGIAMQNRGACFTLEEGHPNQVAGGKRPYHTIIPGFVTQAAHAGSASAPPARAVEIPIMAYGVMGGFMQPQGHAQVFSRIFDFHQNPQAALDAPRWQVTTGLKVMIEPGFEPSLYDELKRRGHDLTIAKEKFVTFGRGQAIYKLDDAYCAGSDLRADGQAVGF
jgi:gamma-glutamyltranspeptidase/glutathione hydrolase